MAQVATVDDKVEAEVTDLLQHLIRNSCVNDGTPTSGEETRSANVLRAYLDGSGLDLQAFEHQPGRESLVARIEGTDPGAPSLMLMGHTDVVPVNPEGWKRDPFGGELVDGEVWGRGAVDMLNLTASMAVAVRRLADAGWRPRGTLIYLAVADEEALGTYGAKWLTEHELDAVRADYVLTESGGFRMSLPSTTGPKAAVVVAEKGSYWCRIRVRGTPGHASMPYRTDNALIKAAEVVRRIAEHRPELHMHETWTEFVRRSDLPQELAGVLLDPAKFEDFVATFPDPGLARMTQGLTNVPFILVGATDARFFRRLGSVAYGAGLFSERISFAQFATMFHGDDERVDVESLRLTTDLWLKVTQDLLG